ncbi:Polynucleotide 5'-hydroxyl-kinase grc3 [Spiromyces aspiralis]|uniref:Polynucleotide 5'-hydroxyl-kinase grc3 n=1 Tax=Spiromyces aspiralis TaxID=68401 RepID=A0ACC1HPW5_9FUNG|nr:Polynucleotide 5'-hydroxyl-kinase grc3 [Spiromyces aspiralis]
MDESSRSVPPVAVLAGNRSCGKSVFLRYLVNRLLSECPYVYYLETDLGQSELMPPGVIGLYRIESPLLGPPFTHASSVIPVHAIYMGVTTPREDPDKYSLSIQHLAQMYHVEMAVQPGYGGQEAGAMPLVVNTQGWIRGLGLDLLGVTCQAVAPTHYYQFHVPVSLSADGSLYQQQAAPQLVPLVDFSAAGGVSPRIVWVPSVPTKIAGTLIPPSVMFSALADRAESGSNGSNGMALSGLPQFASVAYMFEQQTAGTSISNNSSMVEPDAMATSGGNYLNQIGSGRKGLRFSAHDMRTLAMMSHLYTVPSRQPAGGAFRLAWDFDTPVSSRPPLVVPWKDLILWMGDEDVPKNQALRAINGTIVGLVAALAEDQALIKNSHNGARQTSDTDIDSDSGAAPEVQRSMPRIQYGYPDIESFTFVAHAFVRCIDPAASSYHLLVPSVLYANPEVLNRVVGMIKGPGSGSSGIDVPIWALTDGGNGDLAMGGVQSLRQRRQNQQGSATNAPYLSVQATDGVGSATQTVRRNLARKMYS